MSRSPANTALIWRVNSVLSSSLIVCVVFAFDPCTWILPLTLPLDAWPWAGPGPGCAGLGPVERRFWASDPARSLAISYQTLETVQSEVRHNLRQHSPPAPLVAKSPGLLLSGLV